MTMKLKPLFALALFCAIFALFGVWPQQTQAAAVSPTSKMNANGLYTAQTVAPTATPEASVTAPPNDCSTNNWLCNFNFNVLPNVVWTNDSGGYQRAAVPSYSPDSLVNSGWYLDPAYAEVYEGSQFGLKNGNILHYSGYSGINFACGFSQLDECIGWRDRQFDANKTYCLAAEIAAFNFTNDAILEFAFYTGDGLKINAISQESVLLGCPTMVYSLMAVIY
jgi:hypothetical protein